MEMNISVNVSICCIFNRSINLKNPRDRQFNLLMNLKAMIEGGKDYFRDS